MEENKFLIIKLMPHGVINLLPSKRMTSLSENRLHQNAICRQWAQTVLVCVCVCENDDCATRERQPQQQQKKWKKAMKLIIRKLWLTWSKSFITAHQKLAKNRKQRRTENTEKCWKTKTKCKKAEEKRFWGESKWHENRAKIESFFSPCAPTQKAQWKGNRFFCFALVALVALGLFILLWQNTN